jgi:hypothetical protein
MTAVVSSGHYLTVDDTRGPYWRRRRQDQDRPAVGAHVHDEQSARRPRAGKGRFHPRGRLSRPLTESFQVSCYGSRKSRR